MNEWFSDRPWLAALLLALLAGALWENYPLLGVPAALILILMFGFASGVQASEGGIV